LNRKDFPLETEPAVYRASGNTYNTGIDSEIDYIGLAGLLNLTTCFSEGMLPCRLARQAGSGRVVEQQLYRFVLKAGVSSSRRAAKSMASWSRLLKAATLGLFRGRDDVAQFFAAAWQMPVATALGNFQDIVAF
jgi:hypothetical protein